MKILYRGIFIAIFKRTYIQDQASPIIVTSLLSYETSPYFSWREKSLLPKFLSQLEPWDLCNNNDKTWFCHSLTFARTLGRCWKPRASHSVFNTSLRTFRTLMNGKPCLIPVLNWTEYIKSFCMFIWTRSCENVSYAICEQQRCRSACASAQSDQHLCCLLLR